jgi:peptidoglycan hydrolase-like protein with peptidoglycan-binding domain
MGKKIIRLTETDLRNVIRKVVNEQDERQKSIKAIQTFLNKKMGAKLVVDGKTGRNSKTEEAIQKYQQSIGVIPTDGVWGEDTYRKMPEPDKKLLRQCFYEQGDILDKFLYKIGVK